MKKLMILIFALIFLSAPMIVSAASGHRGVNDGAAELEDAAGLDPALMEDNAGKHGFEAKKDKGDGVFRFKTMVPIPASMIGASAIRGVSGAGAAWALQSARGKLGEDGRLKIDVKGLVLADSGVNPQTAFRGVLSCIGEDGSEMAPISTADFPVDVDGNVKIDEKLAVSGACLAPIVFVTGPDMEWFAISGGMFSSAAPATVPGAEVPGATPAGAQVPVQAGTTAPPAAMNATTTPPAF